MSKIAKPSVSRSSSSSSNVKTFGELWEVRINTSKGSGKTPTGIRFVRIVPTSAPDKYHQSLTVESACQLYQSWESDPDQFDSLLACDDSLIRGSSLATRKMLLEAMISDEDGFLSAYEWANKAEALIEPANKKILDDIEESKNPTAKPKDAAPVASKIAKPTKNRLEAKADDGIDENDIL